MPKGFTLLELTIVMALMGIAVVVVIPNINGFNNNRKVKEAAYQLQTDLRTVQNNALSGTQCGAGKGASEWRLVFVSTTVGSENYRLESLCAGDTTPQVVKSVILPTSTRLVSVADWDGTSNFCTLTPSSTIQPKIKVANLSSDLTLDFGGSIGCTLTSNSRMVITLAGSSGTGTLAVVVGPGGALYVQ